MTINETTGKYIVASVLIIALLIFTFMIVRPIFLPILLGVVLAYIFFPIHKFISSKLKNETISAFITCAVVIFIIVVIIWFSIPFLITQIFDTYTKIQAFDALSVVRKLFPPLFASPKVDSSIQAAYSSLLSGYTKSSIDKLTSLILDLPYLILKFMVVLITFFYALRDGEKLVGMLKDYLPFNKATTTRFIQKSKKVTFSVIFGRLVIGIITGTLAGIGFYLAGVDNALLLTVITMVVSILPMIGPWLIWLPIVGALFMLGNTSAALFLLIYSLVVVTLFENLAYPLLISKQSEIPTSFTLIGMIGGMIVFGIFGLILGPLIVAYLLILFDIYREQKKTN
jgi:predicted PurR-regulated permease PerM